MGDFKLTLEPADKIVFSGKLGTEAATVNVKLTNPLKERVAFKVKCTSNEMFRIRPPVGALKAGESVSLSLIFNQTKTVPDNGKHFFAIYYVKAEDEKKTPRAVWTDSKTEDGVKKLFVDFKKEDGGDEKKDEKDDKKEEKKEEKKDEKKDDKKKEEKKKEEKKEEKKKEEKKEEKKKDDKKEEKKEKEADDKKEDDDDDKK